ncbi:MAG: TolC family protein, partial [Acetobacteraceae bacterium]|nr:TolC family protein [Acetobacteraceae bacterium]
MVCFYPARRRALAFILLAGLGGCDLGPDYKRPGAEIPPGWRASRTTAAEAWPSGEWWRGFRSPELNGLINEARARNFDIAAAIARIRQADAAVRIAGAPLLPTLDATGSASYQRFGSGSGRSSSLSASSLANPGTTVSGSG